MKTIPSVRVKPPLLNSLTGIRAIGAWWVVIFHLKDELLPIVSGQPFLASFINAGHVGVTLFFILSGFILAYNYTKKFDSLSTSKYFDFLGKRLARVYPVHLITLGVLLVLVVGGHLIGHSFGAPEKFSAIKFFQHLFLVNGWRTPIETSWNGVAWTLSLEWLCYLFFPLLSMLVFRFDKSESSLFAIAFLLVLTLSLGIPGGLYELVMFVVGVFLGKLYLSRFGANFNWEPITIIAFVLIIVFGSALATLNLRTSAISIFMIVFIYGLAWNGRLTTTFFGSKAMLYWGYTSYSLYMTHPIVLRLLRKALGVNREQIVVNPKLFLILITYIVAIAVVSRLTYLLIEEPGQKLIKNNLKKLSSV